MDDSADFLCSDTCQQFRKQNNLHTLKPDLYINTERKCSKHFRSERLSSKSTIDLLNILLIMIIFKTKNGFISNENNAELSVFYKVLNRNPYSRFSDVFD